MQTVNLMPQGYAQAERSKRRLIISVAMAVAAVMAMLGFARLTKEKIEHTKRANGIIAERAAELKTDRAELASYNMTLQDLAAKYSLIQTVNQNRRWASYLAHLTDAASAEIVLTRAHISPVQLETADAPAPGAGSLVAAAAVTPATTAAAHDTRPKKLLLLIEGYAASNTDVTRFISALSVRDIFEKVTFKGSRTAHINGKPLSKFELECPIRYAPRERPQPETKVHTARATSPAAPADLAASSNVSPAGGRP